mmetsp:Transcript_16794/g.32129  ORF Transcript_16794/g.32129 Transcript_16794/m.32129 type:complete len:303 (+) Transcript_16794:2067-2975(+)
MDCAVHVHAGSHFGYSQDDELQLKGLSNIDRNARKFIEQLLTKDVKQRRTAQSALDSKFFSHCDNTTTMHHNSTTAFSGQLNSIHETLGISNRLQESAISKMEIGDLLIEVDLVERDPVPGRTVISTDHDHVGQAFHLIKGSKYTLTVNIMRGGARGDQGLDNPVTKIQGVRLVGYEEGAELSLRLKPVPLQQQKPPPNVICVQAEWDPAECNSPSLLSPTKWPETRSITAHIDLELKSFPGKSTPIRKPLFFEVHSVRPWRLLYLHGKKWVNEQYIKLNPETRALIKGAVKTGKFVTEMVV